MPKNCFVQKKLLTLKSLFVPIIHVEIRETRYCKRKIRQFADLGQSTQTFKAQIINWKRKVTSNLLIKKSIIQVKEKKYSLKLLILNARYDFARILNAEQKLSWGIVLKLLAPETFFCWQNVCKFAPKYSRGNSACGTSDSILALTSKGASKKLVSVLINPYYKSGGSSFAIFSGSTSRIWQIFLFCFLKVSLFFSWSLRKNFSTKHDYRLIIWLFECCVFFEIST